MLMLAAHALLLALGGAVIALRGGDVAALLDEESPSEWGNFFRNGAVFDVLGHLLEEF